MASMLEGSMRNDNAKGSESIPVSRTITADAEKDKCGKDDETSLRNEQHQDIFSERNRLKVGITNATLLISDGTRRLNKEGLCIDSIMQQLQNDHASNLAKHATVTESMSSVLREVLQLQEEVSSFASLKQVHGLQITVQRIQKETERRVEMQQEIFRTEVDSSLQTKLSEIKKWFRALESLMKDRQSELDVRVALAAKARDLSNFRTSFDCEAAHVRDKFDLLARSVSDVARATDKIRYIDAFAALLRFQKSCCNQSKRGAFMGWVVWYKANIDAHRKSVSQSRLLSKAMIQIFRTRRKLAFENWIKFSRIRKQVAILGGGKLVHLGERLTNSLLLQMKISFRCWHHSTAIEEIRSTRGISPSKLSRLLESLATDPHGAAKVLAQEVHNIRVHDIRSLRLDWEDERFKQSSRINDMVSKGSDAAKERHSAFEKCVNAQLEGVFGQFVPMKEHIDNLAESQSENRSQIRVMEQRYEEERKMLSRRNNLIETRISELETRLRLACDHIKTLEHEKEVANTAISALQGRTDASEDRHESLRQETLKIKLALEAETKDFREELLSSQFRQENLKEKLGATEDSLSRHKSFTKTALGRMRTVLDSPGVRKPKLVGMINLCVLYEKVSKEKGYVPPINCVFEGNVAAELPTHIAAFSHDYASWIAYQADQEVMMLLIAGSSRDDYVYADDNLGTRRSELLVSLKSDLGLALETVHPGAGALKLEARYKFISRMMESTDSALSKYDQIVVEKNTRIGKVRSSSVPVCVACDRPLRVKGRKPAETSSMTAGSVDLLVGNQISATEPRKNNPKLEMSQSKQQQQSQSILRRGPNISSGNV